MDIDKLFDGKTLEEIRHMSMVQPSPHDDNLVEICKYCGCSHFHRIDKDYVDLHVCEQEIRCDECGYVVNYWSYGHYENSLDEDYFIMLKKYQRSKKLERILKW